MKHERFLIAGPSIAYDANWVTGIEVLRLAFYAIKTGQCDSVIVGAANLAQHDEFQHMYNEMGLISLDGSTKAFDANGKYCNSTIIFHNFLNTIKLCSIWICP